MASTGKELKKNAKERLEERYGDLETLLVYKVDIATVFGERLDYLLECEFEHGGKERVEDLYCWNGNLYFFDEIADMVTKKGSD